MALKERFELTDPEHVGGEPMRRSADKVRALAVLYGVTVADLTATEIRMLQCVTETEARAWLQAY